MDLRAVQTPLGAGQQQVQRLRAEPHHQNLGLRIAKAGIVFDQTPPPALDHQTGEKHALIRSAAPGHFGDGGQDDLGHRAGGDGTRQHRRRGIGAHAAGIGAGIAVKGAFVVLGGADGQGVGAIGQHEERGLFAGHELFNHHLGPSAAKGAAEHLVDGIQRLLQRHRHDNALARRQTIGLDHDGRALRGHIGPRRLGPGKAGIGGGGGIAGGADFLGEGFGRLQPCGGS